MRLILFLILSIFGMAAPARAGHLICQPSVMTLPDAVFGLSVTGSYDEPFWQSVDELHVNWLRAEVRWDDIEKKKGAYDFAAFDNLLLDASNHNVGLLIVFDHPPAWATYKREVFLERLEAVSGALAMRAGGMVFAWEVFNEPNLPDHGWPFNMPVAENAALYASAVQAMSTGIRSKGHRGPIIAGAISPEGQPADEFLKAFIAATSCTCFDAISFHPYGKVGHLAATQKDLEQKIKTMAGIPIKVWFTEMGSDDAKNRGNILGQALKESKDVHALFWFTLRDAGDNDRFGLTTVDNLRKPEFTQVKDWLNKK